jgi:hypothetical protein
MAINKFMKSTKKTEKSYGKKRKKAGINKFVWKKEKKELKLFIYNLGERLGESDE